jgi:hypothetical protein
MNEEELFRAFGVKEEKPKQQVVRDAAMGVAIAKCLLYRQMGSMTEGKWRWYHPFTCRFCKYDFAFLNAVHDEYMLWSMAKFPEIDPEDLPTNVANYMALPPDEQARLTAIAQGYVLNEKNEPIGGFSDKLEGRQRQVTGRRMDAHTTDRPTTQLVEPDDGASEAPSEGSS